MHSNSLLNRLVSYLTDISSFKLVVIITLAVLLLSVMFVYLFVKIFDEEYTIFLFALSVVLPLILNPLVVLVLMKLTKHLRYYKKHLEEEIKKNQEKDLILYEQARFVVMGEMMANISHQWKQPLNTINLVILSTKFAEQRSQQEIEEAFEIIESNVEYLAQTVDDFLSFFDKRSHQELRTMDVILKEIKSIASAQLEVNEISLIFKIERQAEEVLVASSISQVVLNLISNAKDALIKQKKEKKQITLFVSLKNNNLHIECCDSGDGVNADIREKIFEPYFTTKSKGRGTGLGLYMSKQIIYAIFGGRLYVDAKRPSCFIISIPFGKNCKLERE